MTLTKADLTEKLFAETGLNSTLAFSSRCRELIQQGVHVAAG
jgi:hypothetical protein